MDSAKPARGSISLLWDGDDGAPGGGIHNGARRHLDTKRLEMGGTVSKRADPSSTGPLPLSSPGRQSAVAPAEPLALLQRPCGCRVAHQATQRELRPRPHSPRHFFANETYFHLVLLAYNLINWFKRLGLPPEFQSATLQTLRHQVLLMPPLLR